MTRLTVNASLETHMLFSSRTVCFLPCSKLAVALLRRYEHQRSVPASQPARSAAFAKNGGLAHYLLEAEEDIHLTNRKSRAT
jgi:hypothetical protein